MRRLWIQPYSAAFNNWRLRSTDESNTLNSPRQNLTQTQDVQQFKKASQIEINFLPPERAALQQFTVEESLRGSVLIQMGTVHLDADSTLRPRDSVSGSYWLAGCLSGSRLGHIRPAAAPLLR